jgi:hypothetical protein
MATKIQRIRRIGAIAIGAVKAIFRTGRAWGAARTRVAGVRRPAPTVPAGAALAAGAAGGAAGAFFLDPKNGQRRRRAVGRRIPGVDRAAALLGRGASKEEAEAPVDAKTVQMAAGNGAGAPVREKETAATAA